VGTGETKVLRQSLVQVVIVRLEREKKEKNMKTSMHDKKREVTEVTIQRIVPKISEQVPELYISLKNIKAIDTQHLC